VIPLPMLTAALPSWWKWIAVALLAVALYGAGFVRGIEHDADRHAEEMAQIAAAGAAQEARTAATINAQKQVTEDTRNGYSQALDALHRYYARPRRVSGDAAGGGQVPTVPETSGGVDARPADSGSGAAGTASAEPDEIGGQCDVIVERCAVTTLRYLWLREWALRQQEEAGHE